MAQHKNRYCCNAKVLDNKPGYVCEVCEVCEAQGICACYDPDSSDVAWDYYKYAYKDEKEKYDKRLEFLSDLNSDKIDDKDYHLSDNGNRLIAETRNNKIPDFGGDVMFNFNHGKYDTFKNVFGIDSNQLKRCAKNHHSLLNFSLMPQTGAMNNFKGIKHKLDRFDYFILELSSYYGDYHEEVISIEESTRRSETDLGSYQLETKSKENAIIRNNFLNTFESVKDYCKQVYFIDEDFKTNDKTFIKRLIDNGKKAIDTKDPLKQYMTLAEDYWEMRHKQLKGVINDNSEKCDPEKCAGHTYTIKGEEKEIQYFYVPKECPQNNREKTIDD